MVEMEQPPGGRPTILVTIIGLLEAIGNLGLNRGSTTSVAASQQRAVHCSLLPGAQGRRFVDGRNSDSVATVPRSDSLTPMIIMG